MDRYLEFILNHYILSLALAVVTYLLIQEFFDTAFKKFGYLSPLLAVAKMNDSDTLVIDVREPPEFVLSHIEQSTNMPLGKLPEELIKNCRSQKQARSDFLPNGHSLGLGRQDTNESRIRTSLRHHRRYASLGKRL